MDDNMTTIDKPLEEVLKDDLMQDIYVEAAGGKAVKVMKNIYGLTNLGRTFLVSHKEVNEAHDKAETQMMQKYGAEIYGISAQYKNQRGNGGVSQTSTVGEAADSNPLSGGGLIQCSVSPLKELPDKFFEAGGDYKEMQTALDNLEKYLLDKANDKEWKNKYGKEAEQLLKNKRAMRGGEGPTGDTNLAAWKAMATTLGNDNWKKLCKSDSKLTGILDNLMSSYESWAGKGSGEAAAGGTVNKKGEGGSPVWNPKLPFRINVTTNFNEDWFKRKYKSGLLNGIIRAVKTRTANQTVGTNAKSSISGKKWTMDEMEPSEKRKLDSIQWKMTNKVVKDYVTYLLGWTRKKEYELKEDKEGNKVATPTEEPKVDTGLGAKFAKNALGGRGFLGRLRQKLFAGGQANNQVQVAFQLADWRDGWKLVESKEGKDIENGDGKEGDGKGGDGKGGSGDGKGGKGAGGSGSGKGGSGSGSGGGKNGKGGPGGSGAGGGAGGADGGIDPSLLQRIVKIEDKMTDNDLWGDVPHPPRSDNKYDKETKDNKGAADTKEKENNKEQVDESMDPFFGVFDDIEIDPKRRTLVEEACNGCSADKLVDGFLMD